MPQDWIKNTLYMDHLMKVINEIQPLPDSFRDIGFSPEIWLPAYFNKAGLQTTMQNSLWYLISSSLSKSRGL
jgi:hypothetical protein